MNRVLGETFIAPRLFVSTLPPVEASGTLLLLPYAIGFVAAVPAAWLALATRRPLAPALSILVGLGATILVSVLVPDHYVLRGVVLAVLLVVLGGRPGPARRGARGPATQRGRGRRGRGGGRGRGLGPDRAAGARQRPDGPGAARPDGRGSGRRGRRLRHAHRRRPDRADARGRCARGDAGCGSASWTSTTARRGSRPSSRPARDRPAPSGASDGWWTRCARGPEIKVRVRIRPGYASTGSPCSASSPALDLDYRDGRTQLDDVRYNQATVERRGRRGRGRPRRLHLHLGAHPERLLRHRRRDDRDRGAAPARGCLPRPVPRPLRPRRARSRSSGSCSWPATSASTARSG